MGRTWRIQTVAAVGPKLSSNPDWVSYLVHNDTRAVAGARRWWDPPATSERSTSRSTTSTGPAACATRSSACPQGMVGNKILVDGKSVDSRRPKRGVAHVRRARTSGFIPAIPGVADDAKDQCGYAPCPMSNRAPDDQVHVPHHDSRPLPLAVLRPLRGRLDLRLRRADADDRLHGRLPQREGVNGRRSRSSPAPAHGFDDHGLRVIVAWLVLSVIATPLVAIYVGPLIPPGNASAQGQGQTFSNQVMVERRHADPLPSSPSSSPTA